MARRTGRPTAYRKKYDKLALNYCLLGATDKELADFFEVSERTINAWKAAQPTFLQSIKRGKAQADAEVASRLYERACGYEHPEDKIFQYEGKPVIVPTTKRYPPDTPAASLWLRNRQPAKWRDKQEIEQSGEPLVIVRDYTGRIINDALHAPRTRSRPLSLRGLGEKGPCRAAQGCVRRQLAQKCQWVIRPRET